MAVDAAFVALLEAVNAVSTDEVVATQAAEDARAAYSGLSELAGPGPELASVNDGTAPGADGPVEIRQYRPHEASTGGLVYFHGGGFSIGDLDTHDHTCRLLADRAGCVVISVDYRLAPEYPAPAGVDDCWSVLRWVGETRGDFAVERLVVGGDSAGGAAAALCAQRAVPAGLDLAGQLLIYPGIDAANPERYRSHTENGAGYLLTTATLQWFYRQTYGPDPDLELVRSLSPLHGELEGLAPALVATAEFDPLRDEGTAYADALRRAGVDVVHLEGAGLIHTYAQLPTMCPSADEEMSRMADWLRRRFAS